MKMFRVAPILSLALCIAVSGGIANADTISASLFSPLAPSGTTPTAIDLTGITAPSRSIIAGPGYTVSFSVASGQGVVKGNAAGLHAVPVAGVIGSTPEYLTGNYGSALTTSIAGSGNYFSTGLGTITFTFSTPQTSIAVLWGSIDTGNSLTFNDTSHYKVTGTAVQTAARGFISNGFQGAGGSAYVVVNTTTPFTTITATSTVPSFEFAALAASTAAFTTSPEPTTFLLIGVGVVMIGFGAHRRRSGKTAAPAKAEA
jgi:PEP-CTERM motif